MTLEHLLNHFGIRPGDLESIKKRVFIVGRFNTADSTPSIYHFSKAGKSDSRFTGSRLSYSSFIDSIRPTLTENFGEEQFAPGEVLPFFTLSPQQMNQSRGDASYVIDPFNYFFLRAISSAEHKHFASRNNGRAPIKNLLKDLPGETIYKQIRTSLKAFCAAQSRNFEIIRAFAQLIARNAGKGGLPANLADGTEFPVNFLPVFIDYLYQEGPAPFTIDPAVVDFDSHFVWQTAMSGPRRDDFLNNLQKLVTAFKNYLLEPETVKNENIPGLDLVSYLNPHNGLVKEELRLKFVAARESYNMLRQIIRSRVLLSMVLQWAINAFQELPSVKAAAEGIERNETVERAINEGLDGLAKPAQDLPGGTSTAQLIKDFKTSFPVLLEYLIDPLSTTNEAAFNTLSPFVQAIGQGILRDPQKTQNVKMMMAMPPEQRRVMIRALENFFTDVIIPRFFKEPGLTEKELLDKYKEYELDLFLTSSILEIADSSNVEAYFTLEKGDKEQLLGSLIGGMIEFLIQPEVRIQVTRTRMALQNVNTLRALGLAESNQLGIGQYMGLLPPAEAKNVTSVSEALTKGIVKRLALDSAGTLEKVRTLPAPGGRPAASLPQGSQPAGLLDGGGNGAATAEEVLDAEPAGAPAADAGEAEQTMQGALQQYVRSQPDDKLGVRKQIEQIVRDDVKVFHTTLSKIYGRYAEAAQLPSFKNKVEALTLARLLLLHKKELNLDKAGTNLFDLLLDLVEKLDAESPDLKAFFAENSLTKYLKKDIFRYDGYGFTALLRVLENQAETSLQNVVQYVSELQGVKYLFDVVQEKGGESEIVVVNATHQEFVDWVLADENTLLKPSGLANDNSGNPQFPALVFMTDLAFNAQGSAFTESEKRAFLRSLQPDKFAGANISIPPLCIATPDIDPTKKDEWRTVGIRLNQEASAAVAPALILGPSLPLNSSQDKLFRTTLSSGYLLCAHLLTGAEQNITLRDVTARPADRFRNIGYGVFGVHQTLKNIIEAADEINQDYSFAADYYLYLVSLLYKAIRHSGKPYPERFTSQDFWRFFYYDETNITVHRSGSVLDRAMVYKKMTDWSLQDQISGHEALTGVRLFLEEKKNFSKSRLFGQVHWFTQF